MSSDSRSKGIGVGFGRVKGRRHQAVSASPGSLRPQRFERELPQGGVFSTEDGTLKGRTWDAGFAVIPCHDG